MQSLLEKHEKLKFQVDEGNFQSHGDFQMYLKLTLWCPK